ncbi:MAG TPA: DinB family protein [Thermoanaerobaculia bacterium]|nr:DinB family protein [Thermoanaerobaculia bacterium]
MTNDIALREHVANLLNSGDAHQDFDSAVDDVPAALRGKRPAGMPHSAWELLEHMRIAQTDILDYSRNAVHVSPEFPDGYWPPSPEPPNETAWDESVAKFRAARATATALVNDQSTDLFAKIPHGTATLLAQLLLIADHNTYHLGQLVLVRRMLKEE